MTYERKVRRFDVQFVGTFAGDHLAGQGTITTLSAGGCSIESAITLPVQSVVTLHIAFPPNAPPIHVEQAIVRWSRGTSFGLEFIAVPEEDRHRLLHFLQQLTLGPTTA